MQASKVNKQKKSTQKKNQKKDKAIVEPDDGLDKLTGEQLELKLQEMRDNLQKSKEKRNMLQIENDMIGDMAGVTKDDIKELIAQI